MDTRGKSNAEFWNEVMEILARHESNFDQIHNTLQAILAKLQTLQTNLETTDVNPFAPGNTPHHRQLLTPTTQPTSNLKLSFPKFNGTDPTGWIYRAEQYFEFQRVDPNQHVQLASFHLDGIALQWHRWLTKFQGPLSWANFTVALLRWFGSTDFDDPSEALTRLKQTTTVEVYQDEFERISQLIDALPESHLIGCFIAGLKDDIRLDVKLKKPQTLTEAIGVARLIEERNNLQNRSNSPFRNQLSTPPHFQHSNTTTTITPTAGLLGPPPYLKNTPVAETSPPPFKRITDHEARTRKEKGLCFYCDEKYRPGHRCNKPQLFMIEDYPLLKPHVEPYTEPPSPEPDPIEPLIYLNRS